MIGKNKAQFDVFDNIIFDKLIPKNHLLVEIDEVVDFSFVYEKLKDNYSTIGRESKDPVMMFKILILEYLYCLSDVKVVERTKTDVVFRWFLGLKLDDSVPDDTTISYFRINHVGEEKFEEFFNEVVKQCIGKGLVKSRRYIIDSTDVAANVNYPSEKKLARKSFERVIKELEKINFEIAKGQLEKYENDIQKEYDKNEHVKSKKYFEITKEHLGYLYIKTYDLLQENNNESNKYQEAFDICYTLVNQYLNNEKDKIVSIVDPEARVAHKSPGNIKRGYKDHIMVDEDSEIILSSVQTPFNVGDEKKLKELVEKIEKNFEIKPKEITADKVYGTTDNRAYLKDNEITANIAFYKESNKEIKYFGLKDFEISNDVNSVKCPNGIISTSFKVVSQKDKEFRVFKFDRKDCDSCKLRDKCLMKNKNGKFIRKSRCLEVPLRYDAVLNDLQRVTTMEFETVYNKRYKIERRFATMARNHGLRRCRYLKLKGAKIHITMANFVCNIVRMINLLLHQPDIVVP